MKMTAIKSIIYLLPFLLFACNTEKKEESKKAETKEPTYQPFGICDCLTGKISSEECAEISLRMEEAKAELEGEKLDKLLDNINAEAEACEIERAPLSLTQCINIHNEMNMMLKEVDPDDYATIDEIKTAYSKAIKECEELYNEEYEVHLNDINETK